jgi:transcriptional regulator with XRE-family HTH domain
MKNKQHSQNIFKERLYQALVNNSMERLTNKELGNLFNVSAVTFNRWRHGKAMPSMARIPIIANKLGVSVEFLLGLEVEQTDTTIHEQLLHYFDKLNDEQQQAVMNLIKSFDSV